MTKFNQRNGITLVALVITIIVMLLLVGVTLKISIDGGLIDTTQKSKYQTEISEIKEALETKKVLIVSENGGKVPIDYGIILNDLDISESLKEGYKDELIISNGILYYNPDNIKETRKNWLEEINIRPYVEPTSQTLVSMFQSGDLKVGDYVSYIPDTVTQGYDPDKGGAVGALTGDTSTRQSLKQETLNWRVLGYDEINNKIVLISGAPTESALAFHGHIGYNNSENVLNDICRELYSKEGIGTARSINQEDLGKYINIENQYSPGQEEQLTNIYHPERWDGTWSGPLASNYYGYVIDDNTVITDKLEILIGPNKKRAYYSYINSRGWIINNGQIDWSIGVVATFDLGYGDVWTLINNVNMILCSSRGSEVGLSICLRPVVSLESNVTTEQIQKISTPVETWNDPLGLYEAQGIQIQQIQ